MSLRQPGHLMLIADRGVAELGPCGLAAASGAADAGALDRRPAAGAGAGRTEAGAPAARRSRSAPEGCAEAPGIEIHPGDFAIVRTGLGKIFHVDELAEDRAADGAHESMFCAPPLPVSKAAGSRIDPVAMK